MKVDDGEVSSDDERALGGFLGGCVADLPFF
jgi:hypothetical protein